MTDTHRMSQEAYWRNMAQVCTCLSAHIITQAQLVDTIAKGLRERADERKAEDPCAGCGMAPWVISWDKPCEHRATCDTYEQWEVGA